MRSLVLLLFVVASFNAQAIGGHDSTTVKNNLIRFFIEGEVHGNIRNFTMSTINQGLLSDYYANAMGASIHYETATFKGFKFGLNGLFIYRFFSNDLNALDPTVGRASSYERQLFDLEHPENYDDLDRLEELYVEYNHKGTHLTLGKIEVESPMVHIHDGRMKPKVFSGFLGIQKLKNFDVHAGWFVGASPRSTTHWYRIDEAIGIYNNGCLENGDQADYRGHLNSSGLGIFGALWKRKHLELQIWDYALDNISNTTLAKVDFEKDSSWRYGLMYMHQFALNKGGSATEAHSFHREYEKTHAVSAMIGYDFNSIEVSAASTAILNTGRYVFPREFGVDPFYTFISRSQLEGLGDAYAFDVKLKKKFKHWEISCDWNRVLTSSNLRLNKYNIPSYDQYNLDITYDFHGALKGLSARFLYVYRNGIQANLTAAQVFNKVDFHQLNLIFNFHF